MLIPQDDRKAIHAYIFKEGVAVAEKDFIKTSHEQINNDGKDIKNLYVIKAFQSLTSRGYLKTQFSWNWYYYTLTPEGLDYLREWLHLPAEIVPQTHVKQQRSHAPPRGMLGGDEGRRPGGRGRGFGPRRDGDEGGYRKRDMGDSDKTAGFATGRPDFAGRGKSAPAPAANAETADTEAPSAQE